MSTAAYLTAAEAADYLGVSRATLYAYVSRGLIASEPVQGGPSRARRYPRSALDSLRRRRGERRDPAGGAPVLESSLTLIDGERLWYRGRDARELSRTATLEEVAALLWTGSLDGALSLFPRASSRRAARPPGPAADRLIACLVRRRREHPLSLAGPDAATLRAAGRTVSALFDAVGAAGTGTLAERLARGWGAPSAADLNAALVLCADHGLATSTFTARCVASTDAPLHNALLAALCALEGRRHGGAAVGEIDELLDDVEQLGADPACSRVLRRRGALPGFGGHQVYAGGDPRAMELLDRLALPPSDPAAQAIAYARGLGDGPTVELALAALARRASLPPDSAFALFALGRSVGWVAHALEAAAPGTLIRPHARYSGPPPGQVARLTRSP
jgi:citrate synthase